MKNYFLMKAHHAKSASALGPHTWLASIKLDGMRAFWDGGVSRNRTDCPWALGQRATGLWTINAKPLYPPEEWLNGLPPYMLDGELWAGPQKYQTVMKCRAKRPVPQWADVQFVSHTPITPERFFQLRQVSEPHCKVVMCEAMYNWYCETKPYAEHQYNPDWPVWYEVAKRRVTAKDWPEILEWLDELVESGHEGLMFLREDVKWEPVRSYQLLKLKPFHDAEAVVVGATGGRETDKGSRLLGKVGALVCVWKKHRILVSGLTDVQRELVSIRAHEDASEVAKSYAGSELPLGIYAKAFPPGTVITFKYRETYDSGLPKDARFWRKRGTE